MTCTYATGPVRCYRERVAEFWEWFRQNETRLSEYIRHLDDYEAEEVVSFLAGGLNRAIEGCLFEIGGNFEVSLASDGNAALILLSDYLCRNIPFEYAEKWRFTPWKQAMPQGCLQVSGMRLGAEDVLVHPSRAKGENSFSLDFYSDELNGLEEDQRYQAFFLLLEMCLGENICLGFIGDVEQADGLRAGMFPLSALPCYMRKELEAEGRDLPDDYNPGLAYAGYSMEPPGLDGDEGGHAEETPSRREVIAGFTRLPDLLDDYCAGDGSPLYERLADNGARPVFLVLPRSHPHPADHQQDLDLCNEIAARLEDEILGETGSGREIGIVLGQAMGLDYCYIDLLLYDERAFLNRAGQVLSAYGLEAALREFRPDSSAMFL
ncbi:MAG: hypothetical protein LBM64_03120 [Deltaproteobacteria bacterium]|jgi:hypothetical protein|nr:hypothetical protein [Deltaproteobacteria bacterium]